MKKLLFELGYQATQSKELDVREAGRFLIKTLDHDRLDDTAQALWTLEAALQETIHSKSLTSELSLYTGVVEFREHFEAIILNK